MKIIVAIALRMLAILFFLMTTTSQPVFSKGKSSTQQAEDKCVQQSVKCMRVCRPVKGSALPQCHNQCGDKLNSCLEKVTITVRPTERSPKVKQQPAAANDSSPKNRAPVERQTAPQTRQRR